MEENAAQNKEEEREQKTEQTDKTENIPEKSETELLGEKIGELEKQTAQLKDQLLRKAAEFENYKRRTETETMNFARYAGENIISQLLPVLDDLTRFLKSAKDSAPPDQKEKLENDPMVKGIELIFNKFLKTLESQGLKAMDTVGKEFNVDFHDALMQVPRSDVAPHTIVEEVEKGYLLYDKVIRHAKVIVSTSAVEEEVKN
jgi:molecular chaperone GrpE